MILGCNLPWRHEWPWVDLYILCTAYCYIWIVYVWINFSRQTSLCFQFKANSWEHHANTQVMISCVFESKHLLASPSGNCHHDDRKKEMLRQQGNPCLRELRKKFTSGASTRQTSTIKLGRRSLVGVRRVLKRAICLPLDLSCCHPWLWSCSCVLMNCLQTSSGFQFCYPTKHLASRHYLSSDLSALSFGLGLQAF